MTETMDKKKQIEEQTRELDVKLNRKLFTLMDLFDQAIETLPDLSKDQVEVNILADLTRSANQISD